MTVTYTAQVATCRGFGCFLKLLFRWRGSIYKLVWLDLCCFLLIYYVLNITYRLGLDEPQKRIFEGIVQYCATYSNLIPLSFVLGFYVSIVMTRWWNQYTSIPWPDSLAVYISANVHGQDERGRLMRRTIMRYVCLCLTMVLTNVSPRVKKRFPTMQHLVDAGLLVENERTVMEQFNSRFTHYSKHWMPIVWAASIVTRARKEGRIRDDFAVKTIIDELNIFRGKAGLLISFDTISVPLVYTQVVTLAVYSFFMTSVMGQQWIENKTTVEGFVNIIDLYFPIFTTLQFFFYMGWLKVAESLINPFGEDDDDFEVNWMIDRNLQVSYMIVDEMHHLHPELVRDQYWDEIFPSELPYTQEMKHMREEHPQPSTANIEIPKSSMTNVKLDEMVGKSAQSVAYKFPENDVEASDDTASGIHFTAGSRRKGSSNSISSMAGSMNRVNTVVSSLKRFFSREDSRNSGPLTPDVAQQIRLPGSASTNSLGQSKYPSMRITDQVIEEVDEQMTITSQRQPDARPTAQSLFQTMAPSQPVDVPTTSHHSNNDYTRTQSFAVHPHLPFTFPASAEYMSTSAPAAQQHHVVTPTGDMYDISIDDFEQSQSGSRASLANVTTPDEAGSAGTVRMGVDGGSTTGSRIGADEHFERLRQAREKDRLNRKIIRSASTQPAGGGVNDTEMLLDQMSTRNEGLSLSLSGSATSPSPSVTTTLSNSNTNL